MDISYLLILHFNESVNYIVTKFLIKYLPNYYTT